jgi:hypothetical protein
MRALARRQGERDRAGFASPAGFTSSSATTVGSVAAHGPVEAHAALGVSERLGGFAPANRLGSLRRRLACTLGFGPFAAFPVLAAVELRCLLVSQRASRRS